MPTPDDAPPAADSTCRPLSRTGATWRLAATAAALGILAAGQVVDTNDWFPLGSLSQYATARDLNGTVRSVYLTAHAEGDTEARHIPLNQAVVGVGRAEIEGQLGQFIDDPSLLAVLARAYAELNPDAPALLELHLQRSTRQLQDGIAVGDAEIETLAEWTMPS